MGLPVFIYWKKSNSKISKVITGISKVSYSMYLLHYSIITVLLKKLLYDKYLVLSTIFVVLLYFFGTVVFSYFLYRFYEKPMMQLRDK